MYTTIFKSFHFSESAWILGAFLSKHYSWRNVKSLEHVDSTGCYRYHPGPSGLPQEAAQKKGLPAGKGCAHHGSKLGSGRRFVLLWNLVPIGIYSCSLISRKCELIVVCKTVSTYMTLLFAACAHVFYKAGARLILCARRLQELERVKRDVQQLRTVCTWTVLEAKYFRFCHFFFLNILKPQLFDWIFVLEHCNIWASSPAAGSDRLWLVVLQSANCCCVAWPDRCSSEQWRSQQQRLSAWNYAGGASESYECELLWNGGSDTRLDVLTV